MRPEALPGVGAAPSMPAASGPERVGPGVNNRMWRTTSVTERATHWKKLPLVASERQARLVMGMMTLLIGMSVLVLVPAHQFGSTESVYVLAAALSTVPVAVAWWLARQWPSNALVVAFVGYADVAVISVLIAFDENFVALAASSLLCLVAVFAAVGGSPRLLGAHLTVSIIAMVTLAVLAVRQGESPWLVSSRVMILCLLFALPLVLQAYLGRLRSQAKEALLDPLTGLWNRRGLFDVLDDRTALTSTDGVDSVIGVIVLDIDSFKSLNDRFGHDAGDVVLCEVARRLVSGAGDGAVVARVGGDEFMCVHRGTVAAVGAAEDRMRTVLQKPFSGQPFTVSVGSATDADIDGQTASTVVRRLMALADIEMYRTKRRVTADTRFDGADTDSPAPGLPAIRHRVRTLLGAGGPAIMFQPVVSIASGAVVSYEALSRFPIGSGSPLAWFRDATVAGVAGALELAAIDNALAAMAVLPPGSAVSLNVSGDTIRTTDLLARLAPHLASRSLCVELTEHGRIADFTAVIRPVEEFRAAGVRFALDDVGAGFASLLPIVELKPDVIKTDISLTHGIECDPVRRAAAAAIVTFAHQIGAVVLMEGVETVEQHRVAADIGVDQAQGFLYGRPTTAEAISCP